MELKLVVLAGAKEGTEIPLKKDKFFIGRAKECNLRAGSEAISRRHCAITRGDGTWKVRDLGSRNGTHVNDVRIEQEVALKVGDELRVGPLKFRIDSAEVKAPMAIPPFAPPAEVKQKKQPPVQNVADAAQRTLANSAATSSEQDISDWLLGAVDTSASDTLKETRTISMQDTKSLNKVGKPQETVEEVPEANAAESEEAEAHQEAAEEASDGKAGRWGFLKIGKGTVKKKPGKLPPRTDQQSKDSREAAADILREMTRRR